MSETRERPIIFGSEMVRAILDGRKTQTRRVMKTPPKLVTTGGHVHYIYDTDKCPYGQPGDRLWVRETWCPNIAGNAVSYYKATMDQRLVKQVKWKPSIHMPRWASRITLEVTGVRVERVQDISERDCVLEGCATQTKLPGEKEFTFRGGFRNLWDSINAKRGYSWDSNPWVWVVEFKALEDGE